MKKRKKKKKNSKQFNRQFKKTFFTKKSAIIIVCTVIILSAFWGAYQKVERKAVKYQKIQLAGFGTFEVTERAARDGINPRTKETIHIPASKAPKFKAMKSLKEKVNN